MPPITFVSMVGHAIFHTAGVSGPSTIERSNFRLGLPGTAVPAFGGLVAVEGAPAAAAASDDD
jgi:hypothetical protein